MRAKRKKVGSGESRQKLATIIKIFPHFATLKKKQVFFQKLGVISRKNFIFFWKLGALSDSTQFCETIWGLWIRL